MIKSRYVKSLWPMTALMAMLGLAALAVRPWSECELPLLAGIKPELPGNVGVWQGAPVMFCQNLACLRSEIGFPGICPACGGPMGDWSPAERQILPADTAIAKKVYNDGRGAPVYVTVVLSGREQKSIHRPQKCLPAQGYAIDRSSIMDVNLPVGGRLPVVVLELRAAGNAGRRPPIFYAYWFIGRKRETPYHLWRLTLMAWDNLYNGIRQQWAYVSVSVDAGPDNAASRRRLASFIAELRPLLAP